MLFRRATVLLFSLALIVASQALAADKLPSTLEPVPRDGGWMKRHDSFNERVKQGNVDLIFIGDSITQGWEGAGKEAWAKHYGKRNAVNLGIGGDRTQHVLWRLDHGNIEGIAPKAAVLMIGTNNASPACTTSSASWPRSAGVSTTPKPGTRSRSPSRRSSATGRGWPRATTSSAAWRRIDAQRAWAYWT